MKKLGLIAICILASLSAITFAQEGKVVNIDIKAMSGETKAANAYKTEYGGQSYWNNKTVSNHDANVVHPINVAITTGKTPSRNDYKKVDTNSTVHYDNVNDPGNYNLFIKNSTWSVYTYFTSGIWNYTR